MIKLQQSWVKEGGMKLHLDLSRQEMETNPNKIAPCGVIVIVEIIRRDCLIIMSLYQSASPQTKPIRIRSQIKVFSIPQRARARLPLKLIDLSRIQTIMPGQAGTQWPVMRHHACTLRVVVKISSCGEGDLRLEPSLETKLRLAMNYCLGPLDTIQRLHEVTRAGHESATDTHQTIITIITPALLLVSGDLNAVTRGWAQCHQPDEICSGMLIRIFWSELWSQAWRHLIGLVKLRARETILLSMSAHTTGGQNQSGAHSSVNLLIHQLRWRGDRRHQAANWKCFLFLLLVIVRLIKVSQCSRSRSANERPVKSWADQSEAHVCGGQPGLTFTL